MSSPNGPRSVFGIFHRTYECAALPYPFFLTTELCSQCCSLLTQILCSSNGLKMLSSMLTGIRSCPPCQHTKRLTCILSSLPILLCTQGIGCFCVSSVLSSTQVICVIVLTLSLSTIKNALHTTDRSFESSDSCTVWTKNSLEMCSFSSCVQISSSHIQNRCGLLTAHRSKLQRKNEPAEFTFIPTFMGTNRPPIIIRHNSIHLLCDTISSG